MNSTRLAKWFLRVGLAFVFVYASMEVYIHPDNFLKYVPKLVISTIPINVFLPIFGISEIVLAIWLLSGWKGQYPSLLSVLMIIGIVVFNIEHFQVLFRNVAIGFGGLALVVLEMAQKRNQSVEN